MKTINIFILLMLSSFFISCSNMTIGLEEDSRFYNGPMYDNRENIKTEDSVPTTKKEIKPLTPAKAEKTKASSSEEETTFSYERDDE